MTNNKLFSDSGTTYIEKNTNSNSLASPIPTNNVITIYSIFHLLKQKNLHKCLHQLEQETKLYFDLDYVLGLIRAGKFKKSMKYIENFIPPPSINADIIPPSNNDQIHLLSPDHIALKIYHDIHLQRYLEKIDENDSYYALKILQKDLQHVLSKQHLQLYQNYLLLLSKNSRKDQLKELAENFVSSKDERWEEYANNTFLPNIAKLIKSHPHTKNLLIFPSPDSSQINSSSLSSPSFSPTLSNEMEFDHPSSSSPSIHPDNANHNHIHNSNHHNINNNNINNNININNNLNSISNNINNNAMVNKSFKKAAIPAIKITVIASLQSPIVSLKYAQSIAIALCENGDINVFQTLHKPNLQISLKYPFSHSPPPSDFSISYSLGIHNSGNWGICCGGGDILIFSTTVHSNQQTYQNSLDFSKLASFVSFNKFDEEIVAYGLYNGSIVVLHPELANYNDLLGGHSSKIIHILFLPKYLISVSYDRNFCIWKKTTKLNNLAYDLKHRASFPGTPSSNSLNTFLEICDISPPTQCRFIFGQGNELYLIHIDTALEKCTVLFRLPIIANITALAYSDAFATILLGTEEGVLEEYGVENEKIYFVRKIKFRPQSVTLSITAFARGFMIGFANGKIAIASDITNKKNITDG